MLVNFKFDVKTMMQASSGTGATSENGVENSCPKLPGVLDFEPWGIFLTQPWTPRSPCIPGIRRDVEGHATTLIFQTSECREEIRVARDVKVDGAWQPSPLSRAPTGGEPPR